MQNLAVSSFFPKVLLIMAVTIVSCVSNISLSARLTDIIEYVETSESISDEEWEYIKEDYYLIVDEFKATHSAYSEEEKSLIYEQIGKMNGLLAKREADSIVEAIEEFNNSIPSIVQGFIDGFVSE